MAKILTKRKQKWIESRKPEMVRGSVINPSAAVETRYYKNLMAMIDRMTKETEKKIRKLFSSETSEEYFAMDASISSQARIVTNALFKTQESYFASHAKRVAESFAIQSDKTSSSQVYESLKELSGGLSLSTANLDGQLKDILSATISENVSLIKSIPQKYLLEVQGQVMRSIAEGNGLQDLIPFLKNQKGITERRARMIAHDQTRKAMNNLSKGRLQNLGVQEYEWIHSGGSAHPRKLHQSYNGKVFRWDDPPIIEYSKGTAVRGHPGDAINCRCRTRPVIKFQS